MGRKQKIFIIVLFSCSLLVLNSLLLKQALMKPANSKLAVGNIFNLESKIKNWSLDLLHLDKFHAKLLLRKGLPVVRVDDNKSLEKSNNNKVFNFTSKLLFDVPPSFFETTSTKEKPITAKTTAQITDDNHKQIKEKMRAEGRHQGEKVELDFWQTESAMSSNRMPEIESERNNRQETPEDDSSSSAERKANQEPVVGIYHTHTAENYENRGHNAHAQAGDKGDIVKVGRWMKERLNNEYNISVIHSEEVHDESYDRSYIRSLQTANKIVDNNTELDMIFDLHRDAVGSSNKQYVTTEINGKKVAKIMIVVTNSNYGLPHPEWQQNFSFAKKLAAKMNLKYPGLLRKVKLISNRRYNQHVHPRALLIEVGGANSSLEEARRGISFFSDVVAELLAEEF